MKRRLRQLIWKPNGYEMRRWMDFAAVAAGLGGAVLLVWLDNLAHHHY